MRIRTRLLVLVLSVLIPAFIAAALAVWFVYKEQQEAQKRGLAETSKAMSLLIDNAMQTTEATLRALATSPSLADGDFETFYHRTRALVPPGKSTVVLTDLAGKQLINTRLPYGATLPKGGSNLMELRKQIGTERTIVSDLFFAPVGKRYDYAVQVPVTVDGQLRYYLAMGVAVSELQGLLTQDKFPEGWIVVVVDRKGTVVARTDQPERFVGSPIREVLRQKIQAGLRSGLHYGVTLTGIPTAAFFTRAPQSEWTVIVNVPLVEMREPAIKAAALLGSIMLFLFGAAIFAARWYAKKTAEPIEELRLAAEKLGRGEQLIPTPSGLIETDSVGYALLNTSNQIHQSKVELERRVAEAVASAERSQRALLQSQKLEALGRLTGGIAHDFNNILQTLSTSLQLIHFTQDRARIESLLATSEKAIDRATVLTGQMRAFGRVQDAQMVTVKLNDLIGSAMPLLQSALPSSIQLDVHLESSTGVVSVDALQLELALLNLVINARDAMPNGGSVTLDVQNKVFESEQHGLPPGNYVSLSIIDNGVGMTPEVLSKALDPFYTTKSIDKGTGLGLPQAYGCATQAKGTLVLHSVEGHGTTATMYLPQVSTKETPVVASRRQHVQISGTGTLLFVEDDVLVREAVEPALLNAGFKVIVAKNGEEAVSVLESDSTITVIFSDIVMPGIVSGIDLAKMVRQRFPHIQIVLATGYTDTRVNVPGVRVVAKPYKINEAIDVLKETA